MKERDMYAVRKQCVNGSKYEPRCIEGRVLGGKEETAGMREEDEEEKEEEAGSNPSHHRHRKNNEASPSPCLIHAFSVAEMCISQGTLCLSSPPFRHRIECTHLPD